MLTLEDVCSRALSLPCSPSLLPRLIKLLENPDTQLDDLTQLIQLDPVLASATLRTANSVYFSGTGSCASVQEAVMRLGVKEVYRLAALSLASRWMSIEVEGYRWEAGDFCRASVVKAVAAEALAQRTGRVDPALAYTCGMVHEIGKLALAFSCAEVFGRIRTYCESNQSTWIEAETAVLGFNYAQVSSRLLKEWGFPESYVAAATFNPPTDDIPAEHRSLVAHVHAADHLAASFGAGQGEDGFLYRVKHEFLNAEGIDGLMLEATMPVVYEKAQRLLRDNLNTGKVSL